MPTPARATKPKMTKAEQRAFYEERLAYFRAQAKNNPNANPEFDADLELGIAMGKFDELEAEAMAEREAGRCLPVSALFDNLEDDE